jgi:hypothetical protein
VANINADPYLNVLATELSPEVVRALPCHTGIQQGLRTWDRYRRARGAKWEVGLPERRA